MVWSHPCLGLHLQKAGKQTKGADTTTPQRQPLTSVLPNSPSCSLTSALDHPPVPLQSGPALDQNYTTSQTV